MRVLHFVVELTGTSRENRKVSGCPPNPDGFELSRIVISNLTFAYAYAVIKPPG